MGDALTRLETALRFAAARGISDVHVKPQQRPLYRRNGGLISRRDEAVFTEPELEEIARALVPARLLERYERGGEPSFMHGVVGSGRFRVTLGRQRGAAVLSVRLIPAKIATLRELGLPRALAAWCQPAGGLLLVTGAAGSGRTATWAALIEQINTSGAPRHVVTLENPLEAVLDDKMAFIEQREVGTDTEDFQSGIRSSLRQDADVLAIDELSLDAFDAALAVAEQRRLVIATLGAAGPVEAIRLLDQGAEPGQREVRRARLAGVLVGMCGQRLVPTSDGAGRVAATELVTLTPAVAELLRSGADPEGLVPLMEQGRGAGMHSLEQSLLEWVQAGKVAVDAAIAFARHPEAIRARVAGAFVTAPAAPPQDIF